ncbi:MAG: tRNA uridine-5-carboxymethylaminomethyl(34) synthesis GTPase MnmE [Acidobacteriaceae bacterium]|nr:tRNA uridine-5-carboxymethylaminomethyl(34) synthesis GTPase MnmE [Acidobacteriaceae bacterium]
MAISTPSGRGGIGIVRLSGPDAWKIAREIFCAKKELQHATAIYGHVTDIKEVRLDEAVATAFTSPRSYTGEDVVELATHGAPVILNALLETAIARGARLAEPGEFTQRAFANGRMDLTQAEAVHDLIAARTLEQVHQASAQLSGSLSRELRQPKETLLRLVALLEAGMDFASGELDDVEVVSPELIRGEILSTLSHLTSLAETFRTGSLLRNGAAIALVGRPNVGKSSLFNRLLQRDRAIVTPIAGTTRDTLEEDISLAGIPIRLVDTAGLRHLDETLEQAPDTVEVIGIERTREALAEADLVIFVHDAREDLNVAERQLLEQLQLRPHLLVANKSDLAADRPSASLSVSALTGENLPALQQELRTKLQSDTALSEVAALTTPRQNEAIRQAIEALELALTANQNALPHEVLLMDLHRARLALDSLTGATTPDDILGRIFSTFCIGK